MTDRTPLREEDGMLAAEYALGVLQGPDRQAFEKRLAQEPALLAELRHWDEHFVSFADEIAPAEAPPHVWTKIDKRLFAQENTSSTPSLWNSLAFWRGLAVAAVAGVVVLGTWNLRPVPEGPAASTIIAQVTGEAAKLKLAVLYDAEQGELRLNRLEGTPNAGRAHELWLITGTDAPVSLGVLSEAATLHVKLPEALRSKLVGSVLAISDEPLGGSPTGAPTGAVLATGELTKV